MLIRARFTPALCFSAHFGARFERVNTDLDKKTVKTLIGIIFAGILFYVVLQNLGAVGNILGAIMSVLMPFILGACIAFIINVPMRGVEKLLFGKTDRFQKSRRPISFVITLVLVLGVIALAMNIIIPQLASTLYSIALEVPGALNSFQNWLNDHISWKSLQSFMAQFSINWGEIGVKLSGVLQSAASGILDSGIGAVTNIIGMVVNFFIGLIFAIYILMSKEKLTTEAKQTILAVFPERVADRILYVATLANKTFSKFISGQCLEACILGLLFFIAMTIAGMPYALLIAVTIAFTALIPLVGAFIGCVVGALLILMESPLQALIFVIMFLIIQQIEGNLIYPHVVGSSVGLPPIWMLIAITIGGNAMGIFGMILFIPLCSVFYSVARVCIYDTLANKGISPERWKKPVTLTEDVLKRKRK